RCFYWQEVRVGTGAAAVAAAPAPAEGGSKSHHNAEGGSKGHHNAEPAPTTPLLDVAGVVKEFGRPLGAGLLGGGDGHNARVLNAVSLSLSDGDTIGLVGESGSGKTTLARCILGLTAADDGHIRFGARDLPLRIEERDASMLRELQMVFQNPDMSLNPRQTIRTILVRPIRLLSRLGRREAEAAARDLLRAVNLDESYMERYPSQLSGGEKQRVASARAFATRTRLVICDAPVSGLALS